MYIHIYKILRKSFLRGSIIFLLALLSPSICFAQADKIFKENSPAVVVVVTFDESDNPLSQGSGFVIRPDGAIVTNYHVIVAAANIMIKAGEKVLEVEGFLYTDEKNDLVILKAKAEGLPTVKLANTEKLNVGEKVFVMGSPQGLENTISDGILSGIRDFNAKTKILQITAPVSPGSSGGPVFNENGEVIGVVIALLEGSQNINFAMPINLINDRVSEKEIDELKEIELTDFKETPEYWFFLGNYLRELRLYEDAVEAYEQSIQINPDNAGTYLNLALAYDNLGKNKDAVKAYEQAIRIDPDYGKAYYYLGRTYAKMGKHRKAIEAYKQSIKINPQEWEVYLFLGFTYTDLGKHKDALKAYKQIVRIDPDNAQGHYHLGDAYLNLHKFKDAAKSFKQAIRIEPKHVGAHFSLGITYLLLDDNGAALQQYQILKELDPEAADLLFNTIYR